MATPRPHPCGERHRRVVGPPVGVNGTMSPTRGCHGPHTCVRTVDHDGSSRGPSCGTTALHVLGPPERRRPTADERAPATELLRAAVTPRRLGHLCPTVTPSREEAA